MGVIKNIIAYTFISLPFIKGITSIPNQITTYLKLKYILTEITCIALNNNARNKKNVTKIPGVF